MPLLEILNPPPAKKLNPHEKTASVLSRFR